MRPASSNRQPITWHRHSPLDCEEKLKRKNWDPIINPRYNTRAANGNQGEVQT